MERNRLLRQLCEQIAQDVTRRQRARKSDAKAFGLTAEELDRIREMPGATWDEGEYLNPFRLLEIDDAIAPDTKRFKRAKKQ